ncbi:MAG: response regulator transcription factor [Kiritimatiellae bacterium]|nr:response regulator transcription factor [Kiritimatiellia bacterium]MDD5522956.1 response regulator transcription factor [Kiritimatiellia bacterium]
MTIRILLADDHALLREGLSSILGKQKDMMVVGEASDGREAIQRVGELKPDIVLMDIAMPILNGIDATEQIRKDFASTRVIILSMHITAEYIHRALKAGALGYILKQSAGREVLDAIRSVYAGHRYLSEKISNILTDHHAYCNMGPRKKSPVERLSAREREILQLVVEGKSSAEIGNTLKLARSTIETYRSRLMAKLDVRNVPALVKFAIKHGLTN